LPIHTSGLRLTAGRLAGLSALFNLPFVLFQAQRSAYDTDSHIFLADHYRRAWFSLWETRWYLGFSMTSYPPLVHQLIALISWPVSAIKLFAAGSEPYPGAFTWSAEETGFVLVLLAALVLLPLALRELARQFVGPGAADTAALLAIFLPAVSLTAWSFGQLPTLLATGFILLALARGAAYARSGRRLHLAQAVSLAAAAAATHHGVFLLVPFAGAALAWRVLAEPTTNRQGERRQRLWRLAAWGLLSGLAVAAVLWPFLLWSRGQQMQTPIDHASRHNFFVDNLARWYFFWPMYGPLLLGLPFGLWLTFTGRGAAHRRRRLLPLLALVLILFMLGLGGTTSLPQLLFGAGWAWLTYDRFAFWAALCSLPFAGAGLLWLWRQPKLLGLTPTPSPSPSPDPSPGSGEGEAWRASAGVGVRLARPAALIFLGAMVASAYLAGWLALMSHAQPPVVEMGPLVAFLDQPEHLPYRYFTLGFGDQMAVLSAITQNGTPDGDYHTARTLPELRTSGLGALDGAVWNPQGAAAVRPLLAGAARYGARWAFVAHLAYVPILIDTGWHYVTMAGTVEIWEHPDVAPVPALPPAAPGGRLAAIWWGLVPLAAFILSIAAMAREGVRRWHSRAALLATAGWLRRAGWVVTVALLGLWWMRVLRAGSTPTAYFTYDSVILYAADLASLSTLGLWLVETALRRSRLRFGPPILAGAGLALIAATALSSFTSGDPALSAGVAAHLLLAASWYWMLLNDPPEAALAARVWALWLAAEAVVVLIETAVQNTVWLSFLNLPWPGELTAPMPGASVIQNAAGARWLRGYGTLPHPNTLGGFVLVGLGAVAAGYLATGRRAWLAAGGLGIVALLLTFSRASWLGAGVMLGVGGWWAWRWARGWWPRYRTLLLVCSAVGLLALLPLLPLLAVRADFSDPAVSTETRSLQERELYALASLHMLAGRPAFGVGAGTFVEVLAGLVPPLTRLEPVHNVILLATTETGLLGGLALLLLMAAVAGRAWQRRRTAAPAEVMWALVLLGMFVTGLFDHYWWTAPPGQLAVATVLGLWAGSAGQVPVSDQVALDARSEALSGFQPDPHKVSIDNAV